MRNILVVSLLAAIASCVNCPTPSGRPELKVSLPVAEAKARLVENYSSLGWMIESSDDAGLLVSMDGDRIRFSLVAIPAGTQVRAVVRLGNSGGGGVDPSQHVAGRQTQAAMESVFHDVMIDGPYATKRAEGAAAGAAAGAASGAVANDYGT